MTMIQQDLPPVLQKMQEAASELTKKIPCKTVTEFFKGDVQIITIGCHHISNSFFPLVYNVLSDLCSRGDIFPKNNILHFKNKGQVYQGKYALIIIKKLLENKACNLVTMTQN